jgi:hypothetical protein
MRRWKQTFLAIACIAALSVALLAAGAISRTGFTAATGVGIAAAILSLAALANTALNNAATEARSQFANSFAVARRWDEKLIVDARDVVRPYLGNSPGLVAAARSDPKVQRALIDLTNFFWDMAAAVELEWADPRYLRHRFGVTLDTLFPAIDALVEGSADKGAAAGRDSISVLRKRWVAT